MRTLDKYKDVLGIAVIIMATILVMLATFRANADELDPSYTGIWGSTTELNRGWTISIPPSPESPEAHVAYYYGYDTNGSTIWLIAYGDSSTDMDLFAPDKEDLGTQIGWLDILAVDDRHVDVTARLNDGFGNNDVVTRVCRILEPVSGGHGCEQTDRLFRLTRPVQ